MTAPTEVVLAALPERTVHQDGAITARSSGRGDQALVFIHAIGIDGRSWQGVTAWLGGVARCVAIDLRGFGGSAGSLPSSLDGHADDIVAVLDDLGIERAHFVGHSYGGAVAATFAARYPSRVDGLTLVASIVTAPVELFRERATSAARDGRTSYIQPTLDRWFSPDALSLAGAPVDYVRTQLGRTPLDSWIAGWTILSGYDLNQLWSAIPVTADLIIGDADSAIPLVQLESAATRSEVAALHIIPGGSHMLPLESPFELARILYSQIRRETFPSQRE